MDNRLSYMDQGSLLAMRASGSGLLVHLTWEFDEPVDLAGLNSFRAGLERGMLGRLIERSPLPWGRHRWVALDHSYRIDEQSKPRPRSQVRAWVSEIAALPIDPERGPGWRLGLLPLDDGGSAVTLVVSHTIADALGMVQAATQAATGQVDEVDYPPRGSRGRLRALVDDVIDSVRSVPQVAGAVEAMIAFARRGSGAAASRTPSLPSAQAPVTGEQLDVPASVLHEISTAQWQSCASARGGSSTALFAAVSARVAERLGRTLPDGRTNLVFPVSRRSPGDTTGNALSSMSLMVDPSGLVDDLSALRAEIRSGYQASAEVSLEERMLPLVPFIPRWLLRRMETLTAGSGRPVGCSSLGDLPTELACIDGRQSGLVYTWLVEVPQRLSRLRALGGKLFTVFTGAGESVYVNVVAELPGLTSAEPALWKAAEETYAEFGLNVKRA